MGECEWYCSRCQEYTPTIDLAEVGGHVVCPYCYGPVIAHDERFPENNQDTSKEAQEEKIECCNPKCGIVGTAAKFKRLSSTDLSELRPGEEVPAGICTKCRHYAYVIRKDEPGAKDKPIYMDEYEIMLYDMEKMVTFLHNLHNALIKYDYLPIVSDHCKKLVDEICDDTYGLLDNPFDEREPVTTEGTIASGV